MKTQCPNCKNEQDVPKEYEGQNIKCLSCKTPFLAKELVSIIHRSENHQTKKESSRITAKSEASPIKCPKCGSTQIMGNKKGFSGGKAVGGALVLGPLGVLAGLHGSKKVVVTCLNCGHKWEPGKK